MKIRNSFEKLLSHGLANRVVTLVVCLTLFAAYGMAQFKRLSKSDEPVLVEKKLPPAPNIVQPIVIPGNGNVSCAQLNASTNPAFSQITDDWELEFGPPNGGGPFPLTPGSGRALLGGMPQNPNLFITYSVNAIPPTAVNSWQLNWTTPSAIDRLVTAVIIKGGTQGTNVYPYPNLSAGDTGPFTLPLNTEVFFHVSFCFDPFTAPSAAPASVSGRVITASGKSISGAVVMIQDVSTGAYSYATTNNFGRYTFKDLSLTDFYVMTVSHRRYRFDDAVRSFTLEAELADVDFVASN